MLGVALAMVVLAALFLFVMPWVGIVAGAVGIALIVAYLVGFGRRAGSSSPRSARQNVPHSPRH